ncbi:MAG TPA: protein kinase [Chthoniobacter sp.]|nr:protein kinase [Chthoniobacter sp.]
MIIPETEIIITKDGTELGRSTVKPGDYVIGRGNGVDILVPAEDVADRHAMLTVNYHELFIEDLGSGRTSVAGQPVTACTRIWANQKVRIGSACFEARRVKAPTDTELSLAPESALVRDLLPAEFLREKKYDIGGLVGHDSMGETVDAFEATTGRVVAMKVMLSSLSEKEILRFVAEAQITSQLEHPNIIPIHELGVDEEDHVFYTTKLVQGVTLKKILQRIADDDAETIAQYPLAQLLTIFQKICDAVAFAHSRTVIHRQLKPSNITIGEYGDVLVMNWGNAGFLWTSGGQQADAPPAKTKSTSTLARVNSSTQLSPVPSPAADTLDPQEDILALGAILFQILGVRPPTANAPANTPVRAHLPGGRIPDSLAAVARKARSADPKTRYASVPELQADITAYQDGFATSAEHASVGKQFALLVRRHKREAQALAASCAVLLALGVGAYIYVARERNVALVEGHRAEQQRLEADQQRLQAAVERTNAESEQQRAGQTLKDLSTAAPAYQRQATALVQVQKFEAALESIGFAIALAPDNPDYPLFQANTLQAMQRLPDAATSYRRVIELRPTDAVAKANLELNERLLATAAGKPLSKPQQTELLNAIVAQKRSAEGVFLAGALAHQDDERFAKIKEQLAPVTQQPQWKDERLARRDDGTVALDLSGLTLPDLALLRGLPVSALNIARTGVSDLTPLAALPLTQLDCSGNPLSDLSPLRSRPLKQVSLDSTQVADLSPLKGMPLEELSLRECPATELAVLAGMPLSTLNLANTQIGSIETLRGMPLRRLDCFGCGQLTDFTPLATLTALETLNLPAQFTDLVLLQKLPSLQRLGSGDFGTGMAAFDKVPSVAAFLAARGQQLALQNKLAPRLDKLRQTLRQLGAPASKLAAVTVGVDGFMDLDFTALPLENLSVLSGLPIRRLIIKGTKVSDLTALRGLPLTTLEASDTPIKDLTPLAGCTALTALDLSHTAIVDLRALTGLKLDRLLISQTAVQELAPLMRMPLRTLYFDETQVEDLLPLTTCTALQSVALSGKVRDPSLLRRLPALARLSSKRNASTGEPTQSAAEFWAQAQSGSKFRDTQAALETALAKMRTLEGWTDKAFNKEPDGTYRFNLVGVTVDDLSPLRDLPISVLDITRTPVTRLGPVANCPIRVLYMQECAITDLAVLGRLPLEKVQMTVRGPGDLQYLRGKKLVYLLADAVGATSTLDLSPLKGMPLEYFHTQNIAGMSLKPLEGAPLKELDLEVCELRDLSPLRHLPLTRLTMNGLRCPDISALKYLPLTHLDLLSAEITDVSVLAECKALEVVGLPRNVRGIEKLRQLPNLKRITYEWKGGLDSKERPTAAEFWAQFDKAKKP